MLALAEPQESPSNQWSPRQIEGSQRLLSGQLLYLALLLLDRRGAEIDERKRERLGPGDNLYRLPIDYGEAGAQRFMAAADFSQRPLQGGMVEPAGQPSRHWDVIEAAAGFQLVQEPQSLLCVGKLQFLCAGGFCQRGHARWPPAQTSDCNLLRQLGNRRRLEQAAQTQLHSTHIPDLGHQARRQQGMTAEL